MIKTQRDLGFGPGNEFLFLFIPGRNFLPHSKTEQQCLVRQGNRRAPFHSKRAKVGYGRDTARLHIRRNPPLSRELDEFLVFRRKVGERSFICAPDHRHHDSIFCFNGDSDVNRF